MATDHRSFSSSKNRKKPKFPRPKHKNDLKEEFKKLLAQHSEIDATKVKTFNDFPLSNFTRKGLKECKFRFPTEIQRQSIGYGLQGRDVLGAAETGSGKTLAFLVPILEVLYCKKWTRLDGLGAMIITPTRELAYQIFETLKNIGQFHDFSAGLIIGGKDLHFEKTRMDQCNIMICTPGRILHHMDVNPLFETTNLQILVLDEADRCLDMGFEKTMNSIIENLPKERQTLLFSATQTKTVKDLARLSLKNPVYVSVHESKKHSTPDALEQSYIVCELEEKINLLWSFIKNHKRQKILIFLSSCKQVKYIYQLFCRLRPGSPLLALYGTLHQLRRMKIYNEFCSKQNIVMFSTDIAARGLDFPEVNWVVQLDCPEDATTYIHRAGRTARYSKGGESLLVLLPNEEPAMLEQLQANRIPIAKIEVNNTKLMSPIRQIEALLARDPELKADAQRAFVSYVKSVFLMKNKDVFNVEHLKLDKYAASLGLAVTPKVRFLKNKVTEDKKMKIEKVQPIEKNKTELEEEPENFNTADDFENDDFLRMKRRDHDLEDCEVNEAPENIDDAMRTSKKKKALTKAAFAKKILKKKIVVNKKTMFTDEGEMLENKGKDKFTEEAKAYDNENEGGIDIQKAKQILKAEDKFDKKLFRDRVKEKHKAEKRKIKEARQQGDMEVRLGGSEGESDDDGSEPDLSWIPDPDKLRLRNSSDDSESDSVPLDSDHGPPLTKKTKRATSKKDEAFDTGLSLAEDEEIALRVLTASSR